MKKMLLAVLVLGAVLALVSSQDSDPVVKLKQGELRGKIQNTAMGDTVQFLGVPYAMPPTGAWRFKYPSMHRGWKNIWEAKTFGASCVQNPMALKHFAGLNPADVDGMKFDEDCLYLNIFTSGNTIDPMAMKPVIVYIHGGNFMYGTSTHFGTTSHESPEALVIKQDVIVVTFNYRLNVFGAYTTGTGDAPGNLGMWDQVTALKWVKYNIAKFGGDTYRVTIMGDGSGGESVSLHMLSPWSKRLFRRAASMSGVVTNYHMPRANDPKIQVYWSMYRKAMKCSRMDPKEETECMQKVPAHTLLKNLPMDKPVPSVVIDGFMGFLPAQPYELLMKGKFNFADYIVGFNSEDSDVFLFFNKMRDIILRNGLTKDNPLIHEAFDHLTWLGYPDYANPLGREIMLYADALYFRNKTNPQYNLRDSLDMMRDAFFLAPTWSTAYYASKYGAKVFMYHFDHVSPPNAKRNENASIAMGAGTGSEVWYVFGDPTMDTNGRTQPRDFNLAFSTMNAFATFAKTGMPKFLDTSTNTEVAWPSFNGQSMMYADITADMGASSMKKGLGIKNAILWNKLLPGVIKAHKLEKKMYGPKPEPEDEHDYKPEAEGEGKYGDDKEVSYAEGRPEPGMKPPPKWKPKHEWNYEGKGKPEGEGEPEGKGKPEGDGYPEGEPEGKLKWDGKAKPEAEHRGGMGGIKQTIAFFVMLALIIIIVVVMVATTVMVCKVKKAACEREGYWGQQKYVEKYEPSESNGKL